MIQATQRPDIREVKEIAEKMLKLVGYYQQGSIYPGV
jgi:hypothetical protein